DIQAFEALLKEADERETAGDASAALAILGKAAKIDDGYADLHYRMGRLHYGQGDGEEAREHFERARDLDALRFRADAGINRVLREIATDREGSGVYLVDVEKAFEASSPHGLPGEEFFYEHVHLTFKGNHLMARVVFRQIEDLLPPSIRDRAAGKDAPCSEEVVAERLAYTGWDRFRVLEGVLGFTVRPPFANQLDIEERNGLRRRNLEGLKERFTTPEALQEAREVYRKALARRPDDLYLRQTGVKLFKKARDFASAAELYAYLHRYAPGVAPWPELQAEALVEHGTYLRLQKKADEALEFCRRAAEVCPDFAPAHYNIGVGLQESGRLDEAIEKYREAVRLKPSFSMARNNLAFVLASQGQLKEAHHEYILALAYSPFFSMAHGNLGDLLMRMGRPEEAEEHYLLALENNPREAAARGNLADLLVTKGRFTEATEHYIAALDKAPRWAALMRRMNDLAWMLATHPDGRVRNGQLAVRLAGRFCREQDPPPPEHLATWAAAYAELGLFEDACAKAEMALAGAEKESLGALALALKGQIALYRARQPIRSR
ncbi:MAG: tetratricopeptide repeat protein, partial [Planctomycetota bacterium]